MNLKYSHLNPLHKRLKHTLPLLAGLVLLAGGTASCDNGCEQTREAYLHTSFVSSSGRSLRSMDIIVSNGETGYQMTGVSKFDDLELALSPADSVLAILLTGTYTDFGDSFSETDTLILTYSTETHFLDLNCGCTVKQELQSAQITHHLFTSVEVLDPLVQAESGINLRFDY